MKNWKYSGPTYYGHPYLDGRGAFVGGHPLDATTTATAATATDPYPNPCPSPSPRPRAKKRKRA